MVDCYWLCKKQTKMMWFLIIREFLASIVFSTRIIKCYNTGYRSIKKRPNRSVPNIEWL